MSPEETGRRGGTRRRGAKLEEALLQAAWAVLAEAGYSGFTYDAIAARAQTNRSVLYRRWPKRHQLLERTLQRFWTPIEIPDTGSVREDGITLLRAINDTRADLVTVFALQLSDYYRETGTSPTDLRRIIGVSRRENAFDTIIQRAVDRGELATAPTTTRIVTLPLDLLRQDMIMHIGPASDHTITEIIDRIWIPLLHSGNDEKQT